MRNKTLLLILLFLPVLAGAQITARLADTSLSGNGYLRFAVLADRASFKSTSGNEISLIKQAIRFNERIDIRRVDIVTDALGITHTRFQLYYDNIQLRGAEYVVHAGKRGIEYLHGFFADVRPGKDAVGHEKAIVNGVTYFNNTHDLPAGKAEYKGIAESAGLLYYLDKISHQYELAYEVKVQSGNRAYAEHVYVHAGDGHFLGAESLVCEMVAPLPNFTGSGITAHSGVRNFVTDGASASGPFRLYEIRNGTMIRTLNNNNTQNTSGGTEFWDNDNNWTLGEHTADLEAMEAHWAAETVYDYWLNVQGRNGINGAGLAMYNYVHSNVDNAQWSNNVMLYRDGFVTLDICAHETGHGIDQYTGDLAYEGESGALDEGFADIWGAVIENWGDAAKDHWLIGEEIAAGPVRDMANPTAFFAPDTYQQGFWINQAGCVPARANDYCGVHTNSGVLNHWFFLLSDGGTGTNGLGNFFNVNGLGINTAARIAYATKTSLNTSNADYPLVRNISIQVARSMFGANSCEEIAVTRAWFAVGVGANYDLNTIQPVITLNPSADCEIGSLTFSLANSNIFPSVAWTAASGLVIGSSGITTGIRNPAICSGGAVTATADLGCGVIQANYNWAPCPGGGGTQFSYGNWLTDNAPVGICVGDEWDVTFPQPAVNVTSYLWTVDPELQIVSGQNTSQVRVKLLSSGTVIRVTGQAFTPCGNSQKEEKTYRGGLIIPARTVDVTLNCRTGAASLVLNPNVPNVTYSWTVTTTLATGGTVVATFTTTGNTASYTFPPKSASAVVCGQGFSSCGNTDVYCQSFNFADYCPRGLRLASAAESTESIIPTESITTVIPNPVTNTTVITIPDATDEVTVVQISNETGHIVTKRNSRFTRGKITVDMAGLRTGVYTVLLRTKTNSWQVKVVKL